MRGKKRRHYKECYWLSTFFLFSLSLLCIVISSQGDLNNIRRWYDIWLVQCMLFFKGLPSYLALYITKENLHVTTALRFANNTAVCERSNERDMSERSGKIFWINYVKSLWLSLSSPSLSSSSSFFLLLIKSFISRTLYNAQIFTYLSFMLSLTLSHALLLLEIALKLFSKQQWIGQEEENV